MLGLNVHLTLFIHTNYRKIPHHHRSYYTCQYQSSCTISLYKVDNVLLDRAYKGARASSRSARQSRYLFYMALYFS